jgi:hypothetical protein
LLNEKGPAVAVHVRPSLVAKEKIHVVFNVHYQMQGAYQ